MESILIIFIVIALIVLLVNWRWGTYLIVIAGFLQDPIRKVIPDQPVIYSTSILIVFSLCFVLALSINNKWRVSHMTLNNSVLEIIFAVYVMFIIFSTSSTILLYGNIIIAILGVSLYLGPLVAAVYANMVFDKRQYFKSFLYLYLFGISVIIVTIWMSAFGYDILIFEEIGGGIEIYEHSIGHNINPHVGIARTSEIAAWHLATGACLSLILAIGAKNGIQKVIFYLLTIACLLSGVFTGRRKLYALFAIFCLTMLLLVLYESKRKHKFFVIYSLIFISLVVVSVYYVFEKKFIYLSFANDYLSRAFTLADDTSDRLLTTAGSLYYTVGNISFLGDGLGSTGQGISGFSSGRTNWNAETGLGRLGNELGILGLLIILSFAVTVFSHILKTNELIKHNDLELSFLQRSLVAFLFANLINYFNAAQAYNDLFILLILGLILGTVLCAPKMYFNEFSQQSRLNG